MYRGLAIKLDRDLPFSDPLVKKAIEIFNELYHIKDTAIPPLVIGGFLFKGSVYEIYIGQIFGSVEINLSDFIKEIPSLRKSQLFSSKEELEQYFDQVSDLLDFGLGFNDLKNSGNNELSELIDGGKSHLESAVRAAIESSDKEAAMHSSFLVAELLMKGGLRQKGKTDKDLRMLSHNLFIISKVFSNYCAGIDTMALGRAINYLPKGVNERYEVKNYSTEDVGRAIMSVQFIAGLAIRALTNRNSRETFKNDGKPLKILRVFP